MRKNIIIRTGIIFCYVLCVGVSATAAGTTGMVDMLNLTGARQAAMGETAQLNGLDPFNLEFNPATIVGTPRGRFGFSHHSFIQDRNTNSLAVIFPVKTMDFGVHMRLSSLGDIEARGNIPTTEPDYSFAAYDYSLKVFSAIEPISDLKVGISLGWIMEKIDYHRANSAALGFGTTYYTKMGLILHASAANIGSDFSFISEKQDMPMIYRVGAAYTYSDLYLVADYVNIKSGESHFHFGGEYLINQILYLRSGLQTGYDGRDFSAGAGFVYDQYRIDYAFVPYKYDLGNSHRFTFTVLLK